MLIDKVPLSSVLLYNKNSLLRYINDVFSIILDVEFELFLLV